MKREELIDVIAQIIMVGDHEDWDYNEMATEIVDKCKLLIMGFEHDTNTEK